MDLSISSPTARAIVKTLVYRDLFDYPLTTLEIHRFLIQEKSSQKVVEEALGKLTSAKVVQEKGGYYFLPGREETVVLRKKREAISLIKIKKATVYSKLFLLIPWVRGVFVTGALAVGNVDQKSDLDILVVAGRGRVWLTRLLVTLLLDLLWLRARPPGRVKDKVCPNMFLDETTLQVPKNEQNLYTAHEVVQAKVIWEREGIHQRFLVKNRWIKKFLPNVVIPSSSSSHRRRGGFFFFDWLEYGVYQAQLAYMQKRKTQEVVTPKRILFHPTDLPAKIVGDFEKRLTQASPALLDKVK
ncbi:hypothetical protein CO059_00030 [candidate division WWE3 bacterium CG_4_9_14_0_2_um_filter_48_10]|uniref:Polymerase nucleotidyl transferase domain-containing protein n=1 Tax=candidate division WWE3 bacterium CG_4_9_14_0_2_um_filter_48_10 TaxID=1975078 RepID=A0A2M8EKJ7_UNCKA|nr:MAG: hypothetical protein COY35_00650 [candidate division WWE3 bacterium CG_4_10_14_0_2_um_filter_47_8]PJC23245.1 MAG: hypothetical protein CO059_00030 [candidate division WWE3 bacterium CG_4_9_14_0_2_um_filter_48_10]